MIFRYDFLEKFDLTTFKKQANYYIPKYNAIIFVFYTFNYKIESQIISDKSNYKLYFSISLLKRDSQKEIIFSERLNLNKDILFSSFSVIKNILKSPQDSNCNLQYTYYSINDIINNLSTLIKIAYKAEDLIYLV